MKINIKKFTYKYALRPDSQIVLHPELITEISHT